jgi:hypothetical protein
LKEGSATPSTLSLSHSLSPVNLLCTRLQPQTVEGNVSVIFSREELEEVLVKNSDQLTVLFCGLTWCRCAQVCRTGIGQVGP